LAFTGGGDTLSMYRSFFRFSAKPFTIQSSQSALFMGSAYASALSLMRHGIKNHDGITVITGEVGCGKTTLCQALLAALDAPSYAVVHFPIPPKTEEELLHSIAHTLKIDVSISSSMAELRDQIAQVFGQIHQSLVLLIDEAQNLSNAMLEDVRLLSNITTRNSPPMHIMLLGQPELKQHLQQSCMRQLRQRISVFHELRPMRFDEMRHYMQHRLHGVQTKHISPFTYWALRKIFRHSKGIPRLINHICDKALLSAYLRNSYQVKRRDVIRAIQDIQQLEIA
jgi:general secretion pathway protein A